MKKIMISGVVALVFTSCASTKSGQFATEGLPVQIIDYMVYHQPKLSDSISQNRLSVIESKPKKMHPAEK